jgi:electron transfer flavoprotein alpha subunit
MAGVWIVVEHRDGALRKVTFEAATAAKTVAEQIGGEVTAVMLAQGMEAAAADLGKFGVNKVLYADNEAFATYSAEAYVGAIAELAADGQPDVILLPASVQGKDLGGRLAAKLNSAIAVDCTGLAVEDGKLKATRPMYAGKVYADVVINATPAIASLRPNVFGAVESGGDAAVEAVSPSVNAPRTTVVEAIKEEEGKIELTEAEIIVSGGRGMKGPENYNILEDLAGLLGAAVGASRSAVDAGWRPHGDQVGQTGKVVCPNLYVACGISGAIQHLAGMGSSKVIVAINKDPDAPIHTKADYSVVADLFDVLPALTEACKKVTAD